MIVFIALLVLIIGLRVYDVLVLEPKKRRLEHQILTAKRKRQIEKCRRQRYR